MKAKIYVTLKPGVLDPAGRAVVSGLHTLDYPEVEDVRIGKYFEVTLHSEDAATAQQRLGEMCKKLLANTVIENYRIEISS